MIKSYEENQIALPLKEEAMQLLRKQMSKKLIVIWSLFSSNNSLNIFLTI
jgi:hypothetical protein